MKNSYFIHSIRNVAKMLAMLFVLTLGVQNTIARQDQCNRPNPNFCPGNFLQNGDFETITGNPNLSSDVDVNMASGWLSLWNSQVSADLHCNGGGNSTGTAPVPNSFVYAGMWIENRPGTNTVNASQREGMQNRLATPIAQNSGQYTLEFNIANALAPGGNNSSSVSIGVYGVYNPNSSVAVRPTGANANPTNVNLWQSVDSSVEVVLLGTITTPSNFTNTWVPQSVSFDSAILPDGGITHIMITADDNARPATYRKVYVNFDEFCLQRQPCEWLNNPFTPSIVYGLQGSTFSGGVDSFTPPIDCQNIKYTWTFDNDGVIEKWNDGSVSFTFPPVSGPFGLVKDVCVEIACFGSDTTGMPSCVSQKACVNFPLHPCEFETVDLGPDTTVCDTSNFVLDAGPGWPSYKWFEISDNTNVLSTSQTYQPTAPDGVYIVEVSNPDIGKACTKRDTIKVKVKECDPCISSLTFDAQPGEFCTIDFAAIASGIQIVGYHWDFGDGATAVGPSPSHQYDGPGIYAVTLTVIGVDADGKCCTRKITRKIKVVCKESGECLVRPDFSVNNIINLEFQFTNESVSNSVTTIVGYHWDFGDNNTSTAENPIHTYNTFGVYRVTLTVYGLDKNGDCCMEKIYKYIKAYPAATGSTVIVPEK